MSWIEQLEQARETLTILRGSIRGNSPSQEQMAERLQWAIHIIGTHLIVEQELMP